MMADFFEAAGDGSTWDKISRGGLERIRSRHAPATVPCAIVPSVSCARSLASRSPSSPWPVARALEWSASATTLAASVLA